MHGMCSECVGTLRGVTKKRFFVFVYRQSQKRNGNGNETTIPEVVFVCFAMLSVSLCGTFNQFAVHENETEKRFIVIFATSQHILSMRHVRQQFPKIWSILMRSDQCMLQPMYVHVYCTNTERTFVVMMLWLSRMWHYFHLIDSVQTICILQPTAKGTTLESRTRESRTH